MSSTPTGKKPKNCFIDPRSPYWQYEFAIRGERERGSTGEHKARDAASFVEGRKALMRKNQANLRDGLALPLARRITLTEACDRYERKVEAKLGVVDATTKYQIENLCVILCQNGEDRYLHEIQTADFTDYRVVRGRLVGPTGRRVKGSTINREIELARRIWVHALNEGCEIGSMPRWATVIDKGAEQPVERELSASEEKALFSALTATNPDLAAMAEFAMLTGLRRAAVVRLKWSDIDWEQRVVKVRLKTKGVVKREHRVPMTGRIEAIIQARPTGSLFVFTYLCQRNAPSREDRVRRVAGERFPFSLQGWNRQWRAARSAAGVTDFRWHDLRHTAATRLLRKTNNLKAVQELLGHKSLDLTVRYAHMCNDDLRRMMEAPDTPPAEARSEASIHHISEAKRA
jgi:integrase